MIVKMKKLTLLCLAADRDATITALRKIGVLHLTPLTEPQSTDLEQSQARLKQVRDIQSSLVAYRRQFRGKAGSVASGGAMKIVAAAGDLLDRKRQVFKTVDALRRERIDLEPYGNFDPATVRRLAAHGIAVNLYHVSHKKPIEPPSGTYLCPITRDARGQFFAIAGPGDFEFADTPLPLPERSLRDVDAALAESRAEQREIEEQLIALSADLESVDALVAEIKGQVDCFAAHAGMGKSGRIDYLRGFCPVDGVARVQAAAAAQGWGLVVADPEPDERVPTLIRNPAWVRPINVLFRMLDILPGYAEVDIRSAFLIFFTLFFAILVGDAGYGLIFLAAAIFFKFKLKNAPAGPFRLVILLSLSTIAWGAITGNYFGIAALPAPLRGLEIPWMKDDRNLMAFSFLIGAIHLTLARAWAALRMINSTRALGQVGWICLSWCMYFLARHLILGLALPGWFISLFVAGLALLVLFMTPFRLLKTEWADHVMLPFDVIGSFADVVSYVRLFAVGSAGLAVAIAFNELAVGEGVHGWAGGLKAGVILLLGHALNIILCLMSILVHGVRLNTLEFSRSMSLEWSGFKYQPFADSPSAGDDS